MISSWRGLAIATAIAAVLAIVVAVDLGRAPAAQNRALVPGFDPEGVTQLVWERAGRPTVDVVRMATGWRIRSPSMAPADPSAISDVLAALRGARWHRRGEPRPTHASLTITSGPDRHVLRIGEPIAGTDQVWIVDDDQGLVVDSWVGRALDRELLSLRIRSPLAEIGRSRTIVIESADRFGLRLEGMPRRLVRPVQLWVAAEVAGELERALGELTIARLPAGPVTVRGLAVTIADSPQDGPGASSAITVELGGSCPGSPELVAMSGTAGDGCVDRAAATAVERAIARLRGPPEGLVDRRPMPFEPQRMVLADGVALELSRLRVGEHPADQARVAELVAALSAPAEVVPLPSTPAARQLRVIDHRGEEITLDLFAGRVVARRGEPVALRPAQGAWSLLVRPSRELREVALWLEEPTTVTTLRIDGVTYERGKVIGEWSRAPSGIADGAKVEALVALLAAPRALGFLDDKVVIAHRVALTIAPPAGPASERVLEIGRPRPTGCPARIERDAVLLSLTVCLQIAAVAK